MIRPILAAAALVVATPALAETQLERFEALADEMNVVMLSMMANEIEQAGGDATALRELDGMMPSWNDEMRVAAQCMLESYEAEGGDGSVDTMFDKMEEALPQLVDMTMTEAEENGTLDALSPGELSDERTIEINQDCGMMDLQMAAASESGFREAMMEAGATVPGNN